MSHKLPVKIILGLIVPILIIVAWILATTYGDISVGILPPLSMVGEAFVDMIHTGELQQDLLISLSRVLKGYLIAAVLGIILGSFIGMSVTIREMLVPIITVIRQIPIIAWIPLIIMWAGIAELSKVIVIVLAAFFPIMVNTENGMEQTPGGLVEVAKLYRLNPWQTFVKVYLPHAIPHILVGMKLGLGVSWMAVVAAEMIASSAGIGYRLNYSRSMMQANKVMVCMIVIGLVGVIMDKLIGWLFSLFTPWQKAGNKD
jgi:sulfonate transport system permease protein